MFQVILETLFDKVKAQSAVIQRLTREISRFRDENGTDIFERLRFMESRLNEAFGEPGTDGQLSPFRQQDLIERVDHLETILSRQKADIQALTEAHEVVRYWRSSNCISF
jgi:hypothetical protein